MRSRPLLNIRWAWETALATRPLCHASLSPRSSGHRCYHRSPVSPAPHLSVPSSAAVSPLPPPPVPSARLSSLFTSSHASHLSRYGFAIIDNAFGDAFCSRLHSEALFLHDAQLMFDNHTHLVTQGGQRTSLLPKRGIHEADTHTPGLAPLIPTYHSLTLDLSLLTSISSHLPSLHLHSQSLKVQLNSGARACFPLHFDSYPTSGDPRLVTAILYLNPHYHPSHGGQLQLFPLPYAPVTIDPLYDRLVLFSTPSLLHRVLPSTHRRICVSTWMTGAPQPLRPFSPPTSPSPHSLLTSLLHPRVYPHYCKLYYAQLWAESIAESHPQGMETEGAVAQHWRDVEKIEKTIGRWVEGVPKGLVGVAVGEEKGMREMKGVRWEEGERDGEDDTLRELRRSIRWEELHRFI